MPFGFGKKRDDQEKLLEMEKKLKAMEKRKEEKAKEWKDQEERRKRERLEYMGKWSNLDFHVWKK